MEVLGCRWLFDVPCLDTRHNLDWLLWSDDGCVVNAGNVVTHMVSNRLPSVSMWNSAQWQKLRNICLLLSDSKSKVLEDTKRIDQNTWFPPLVDSDWSAMCQTLYGGVEQEDWVSMYTKEGGHQEGQRPYTACSVN